MELGAERGEPKQRRTGLDTGQKLGWCHRTHGRPPIEPTRARPASNGNWTRPLQTASSSRYPSGTSRRSSPRPPPRSQAGMHGGPTPKRRLDRPTHATRRTAPADSIAGNGSSIRRTAPETGPLIDRQTTKPPRMTKEQRTRVTQVLTSDGVDPPLAKTPRADHHRSPIGSTATRMQEKYISDATLATGTPTTS